MDRLWAPWRLEYVSGMDKDQGDCIFCAALTQDDDAASYVLHRGQHSFALLNAFPYNTGHLMVAPIRHLGDLETLDPAERTELIETTTQATSVLRATMGVDGFNVGMNLGSVGGAGIPDHVHMHVVPRWRGDTNFMPLIADTKVMPETLEQTYAKLRDGFARG
jgi:ATP adenylyltransferase